MKQEKSKCCGASAVYANDPEKDRNILACCKCGKPFEVAEEECVYCWKKAELNQFKMCKECQKYTNFPKDSIDNDWEKEFEEKYGDMPLFNIKENGRNVEVYGSITNFIKDLLSKNSAKEREEGIKIGRIKELEILRLHLERQVIERTINTDSIYYYISEALKAINKQ
jgi:hypothetical protein